MDETKIDPLANCIVCLTSDPPLHIKHAVVIGGFPFCHTHAADATEMLLLGKGDFR